MILRWKDLRQCFNAPVTGAPRWYAQYIASGLCRLKWLGVAGLVVWLVQGIAITHWAPGALASAAERLSTSAAVLVAACLLPAAFATMLVMATGRQACTIRQARALVVIAVALIVSCEGILLGLSQVNMERVAPFDLTLLTLFAVAPLGPLACGLITAIALTSVLVAASLVDPVTRDQLQFCVHGASFALLGITVNLWVRGAFRMQWLAHLKLARRARQLEAHKLRIDQLVRQLTDQNLAKTRFLAAASHDLRQPMHAIGILVGALRKYITFPEVKVVVDRIESSVEAMDNLFNTLLDVSKLDANIVTPKATTFAIRVLLAELELQYAPQAIQKGLSFRVIPSNALVQSDPTLLRRILMNLVSNAVHYTATGRIVVGCKRSGNFEVRIMVCDTGSGIPLDQQENIFGEFVQLQNPARDRSKGLGLGLAIVRRTAELLGHAIAVDSCAGRGSTFAIRVPLMGSQRSPDDRYAPHTASAESIEDSFVVVVDDEQDILFSMDVLLKKHGCHVLCARSGNEAVASLGDHLRTPDLIISDYRFASDETGLDVIRKIREAGEANIPALLVTATRSSEIEATSTGYPVMFKPLSEKQLLAKMGQMLRSPEDKSAAER